MRETGLEPVRSNPHAPQTCASASSATSAWRHCLSRMLVYHSPHRLSRGLWNFFKIVLAEQLLEEDIFYTTAIQSIKKLQTVGFLNNYIEHIK